MEERRLKSRISGSNVILSNTRIVIEKGAEICGSTIVEDYVADDSIFIDTCNNEFGRSLFYARGAENIELVGEENSIVNGQGRKWKDSENFYRRPSLIRLVDCKNVKIKNITLIDSACWAVHLHNCENVEIENVKIISKWCSNNDGIDLDCCRNVTVRNCSVETEDDAIVLKATKNILSKNIVIENCELETGGSGFKIGTESVGDFESITYRNNVIKRSNGCAVKIVPTDGAIVKGVKIENVECVQVTGPIFIANGERMRTYYSGETRAQYGKIHNITIRGMSGKVYVREDMPAAQGKGCIFISGTNKNPIESVKIEDCEFEMAGGETEKKEYVVEELGTQYPEYYTLGTAPANGAYFRNIKNVVYKNVKIHLLKQDARKEVITENVNKFKNY